MHDFFQFFKKNSGFFGISATIRIGREMPCIPYAGFVTYLFPSLSPLDTQFLRESLPFLRSHSRVLCGQIMSIGLPHKCHTQKCLPACQTGIVTRIQSHLSSIFKALTLLQFIPVDQILLAAYIGKDLFWPFRCY